MPFQFRKEAIEEDLNSNFPSQGQGNPPLYYSLSEVVVPTYSINSVTEGSGLPENLQTAWDFSTGSFYGTNTVNNTLINNAGFWKVTLQTTFTFSARPIVQLVISDGLTDKTLFRLDEQQAAPSEIGFLETASFVVFLRSGDSLVLRDNLNSDTNVSYRQIATVNGELVNPLGFSFA